MNYADKTELLADYFPGAKSAPEIAAIERILGNVSAFVDKYCRRATGYFLPSPEDASMRRVRGEGYHFLRLPVHVFGSISSVTLNRTAIDPEEFYESDKNGWLYFENNGTGLENTFSLTGNCSW